MPERGPEAVREREQRPEGEEEVLWEGRPSIVAGIDSRTTRYRITNRRIQVIHSGLRSRTEEIPLSQVQGVTVYQSLTDQTAGVGDVIVSIGGGEKVILEELHEYQQVAEIIRQAVREQAGAVSRSLSG